MMKRREFITLIGGAATWPLAARTQNLDRLRRVGVLMNGAATQPERQAYLTAFVDGLRQLGWTEGENIRIDVRWNAGDAVLARTFAAQLVGLMPDVLLIASTTNLTEMRQMTSTVPIVFTAITDPVAQGFVASLSQPGGNITGFTDYDFAIGGKWLDLLKKVMPSLTRAAVMFNPDTSPQSKFFMQAIESAASSVGASVNAISVHTAGDIESGLGNFARLLNGGLILTTDSFTRLHRKLIADFALRYRLPSISYEEPFVVAGGLMTYGTNNDLWAQYRRAADYVNRILKGARPADLPVQGADRYKLTISLKTARLLNLAIPPGVLAIADQVIE